MGAGKACRADWRHADFVHTAQDRGGQPDCSWPAQPAGHWQNCYRVLHGRAEQSFYSCHWAFAGPALPSRLFIDVLEVSEPNRLDLSRATMAYWVQLGALSC